MISITYIKKCHPTVISFYFCDVVIINSIMMGYKSNNILDEIYTFYPINFTQKFYKNLIHKNYYEYVKQYD